MFMIKGRRVQSFVAARMIKSGSMVSQSEHSGPCGCNYTTAGFAMKSNRASCSLNTATTLCMTDRSDVARDNLYYE